jgi:Secretion system C-terminal sorting domain
MKRMLLAVLSALTLSASAQITITNAVFPVAGDTLRYANDVNPVGVNPATPPGGNQTWMFNGLVKDTTIEVVFKSASSGMHFLSFPGAELMQAAGGGESYFNVTPSTFSVMGYAGAAPGGLGLNATVPLNPALIERRAPTNFFDINSQTSNLRLTLSTDQPPLSTIFANLPVNVDSLRILRSTNRIEAVDGWGTCQIPGGQYPVLRNKRTDYVTSDAELYVVLFPGFGTWVPLSTVIGGGGGGGFGDLLGTDTTVTYLFLNGTEKEEIAVATMSNDLSSVASMRFKNNATVDAPVLNSPGTASISAFPNPAIDWVRFDYSNLPQDQYTLKIFNIIGREVWKETYQLVGTHHFRVELENFKKGTYLYSLSNKKGNVIGTKRLVVLKP